MSGIFDEIKTDPVTPESPGNGYLTPTLPPPRRQLYPHGEIERNTMGQRQLSGLFNTALPPNNIHSK